MDVTIVDNCEGQEDWDYHGSVKDLGGLDVKDGDEDDRHVSE